MPANDFIDVAVNDPEYGYKSDRLLDRLAGEWLAGQDWQDDDVAEPDEDTLFSKG